MANIARLFTMIFDIEPQSFVIGISIAVIVIGLLWIIFRARKQRIEIEDLMSNLKETSDCLHKAHNNINQIYEILNESNA